MREGLEMKKAEFSEFRRCKGLVERVASEEEHCRKENSAERHGGVFKATRMLRP